MKTLIVAVILFISVRAVGAVQYQLTGLGTLGGQSSVAYGINNNGQVVGSAFTGIDNDYHAFLYSGGSMQDLGTLGGSQSVASAINNSGQIVGRSLTSGNAGMNAFLYSNGSMQNLGTSTNAAYGINSSGQIALSTASQAILYSNSSMFDIGALTGSNYSQAYGINDSGQVVGIYGVSEGFLYSNGSIHNLGALGNGTFPSRINNTGKIVGASYIGSLGGDFHAFLSYDGIMQDLGTLDTGFSKADGINNNDQIVGGSFNDRNTEPDRNIGSFGPGAFLYSAGTMQNLNNLIDPTSGWILVEATGINDSGQIVGYGLNPLGQQEAFLLTPIVPEPSVGLVVFGMLGFFTLARKTKR